MKSKTTAPGTSRCSTSDYAYLDQAPLQPVDIHRGFDDTLVILRSKLKRGIAVHREYAPDLPRIQAYGSELNQVWTNLIDNAIDALLGEGDLSGEERNCFAKDRLAVTVS